MVEEPILETEIFKTVIAFCSPLVLGDAIQYQGKFWLVPEWLVSPDGQWRKPKRIISLENLEHQDLRKLRLRPADLAINESIPKDVLDGKIAGHPHSKYVVVELPPFRIRKPKVY
jgi:hypothetical protein